MAKPANELWITLSWFESMRGRSLNLSSRLSTAIQARKVRENRVLSGEVHQPRFAAQLRQTLPGSACRSWAAFAESAVNEIVAKRMNKNQQMRWNRYTVQPFLTVRVHVLNGTLEDAFRALHRSFRPPKCAPVPA